MAQYTATLTATADTWIDQENQSATHGSDTSLKAGTKYSYPSYEYDRDVLLKFDTSSIPARKAIISTALRMYLISKTGANVYLYTGRMYSDFVEASTNYANTARNYSHDIYTNADGLSASSNNDIAAPAFNYPADGTAEYAVMAAGIGTDYDVYLLFGSRESANPPKLVIVYEDAPPGKPVSLVPVGTYQDSSGVIRLDWTYVSSVGGTQKGYNLQWSSNGGGSWTTLSETTANTYRDVAAGTFPAGNITWKVQTINEYDETSDYSDAVTFYSIAAPATPIVTVGAGARPEITWTSDADQQVYQVQILSGSTVVYDSEVQAALATRAHTPATYLANAAYTARVRYKNQYDMWSAWGSTSFTVAATAPATPTLSAAVSGRGIALTPGSLAAYTNAILYRCVYGTDAWEPIAIVTGAYQDNAVAHGIQYDYKLRGATATAYADSTTQSVTASLPSDTIASVDGSAVIDLTLSQEQTAGKTLRDGQQTAMTQYAGRTRPVAEFSGFRTSTFAATYHVASWAEIEAILALAAMCTTILYRDRRGRKVYGVLSTVIPVQDTTFGYAVGLTIDAVEYDEEVAI